MKYKQINARLYPVIIQSGIGMYDTVPLTLRWKVNYKNKFISLEQWQKILGIHHFVINQLFHYSIHRVDFEWCVNQ